MHVQGSSCVRHVRFSFFYWRRQCKFPAVGFCHLFHKRNTILSYVMRSISLAWHKCSQTQGRHAKERFSCTFFCSMVWRARGPCMDAVPPQMKLITCGQVVVTTRRPINGYINVFAVKAIIFIFAFDRCIKDH